ncbi:MAG: YgjV family protein [Clostridia bacterium]|nr:YgjV family protein [Clostridia bacterium]
MQNYFTLLGHTLGFISVGLFFYSYQRTQKSKIMLIQTAATALSCVQYLLIGATSGFALNIVCIIRNFAFYYREKNNKTDMLTPALFGVAMAVVSCLSWEGVHSLLITLGLVINTVCMGVFDAKDFRKTILISSALILEYNLFALSYSGMLSETISLVSVVIGIIRYRGTQVQSVSPAKKLAA